MTLPTTSASESMQQEQPAQQSNKPKQLQRKHDRLITRDMALVMLATFCFMSSNMLANPIVAGYAESLGASGMLMGVVAGSMSFTSLFCRPIRRQSFRQNQQTYACNGRHSALFHRGTAVLFRELPHHAHHGACDQRCRFRMLFGLLGHVDVASAADSPYGCRHGVVRHNERASHGGRPGIGYSRAEVHRLPTDVFKFADIGGDHADCHVNGEEWRTAGTQKAAFHNGESLPCRRH